jgi:hypothetical protein
MVDDVSRRCLLFRLALHSIMARDSYTVGFDERWLQPNGIVPVDPVTTGVLLREIIRMREQLRLNGPNVPEWLRLDEFRPKAAGHYLTFDGYRIWPYWWVDGAQEFYDDNGYYIMDVSHWMPLPNPPHATNNQDKP